MNTIKQTDTFVCGDAERELARVVRAAAGSDYWDSLDAMEVSNLSFDTHGETESDFVRDPGSPWGGREDVSGKTHGMTASFTMRGVVRGLKLRDATQAGEKVAADLLADGGNLLLSCRGVDSAIADDFSSGGYDIDGQSCRLISADSVEGGVML